MGAVVRIAWGTGTGPTEIASYDAALADAGVHNYNLVLVSSIIPAGARVEPVGTAPDLGPAGNQLTAVQARATGTGPGHVTAGLGWATGDGPGLLYEAAGEADEADIRERVTQGLAAGRELREWSLPEEDVRTATAAAESGTYTTAVVLAAYGESEPILPDEDS